MSDSLMENTRATIIPTMRYRDARAAVTWLCEAFGFAEKLVVPGEGETIRHCQLTFGNGMVMLSSARDSDLDAFIVPPDATSGLGTQSPYIVVTDVDAHHARAVAAGADIVVPLTDEGHGRGYSCRDPEGHIWNFGDYDPWA